jgi:lysophospholipase L1-like esterase
MSRSREYVLQFMLAAASLLVCLVVAEGVLRLKNSSQQNYDIEMWRYAKELKTPSEIEVLGHEHLPGREATLQNTLIRINAQGLRGAPLDLDRHGKRRILFLGSSITLGWGVPEDETVTARIAAMFHRDGKDVQVLNAGIGNYNAVRYVERFLQRLTQLQPTDIVIHYFLRDAETLEAGGGNFLLRHSELAVTLWQAYHVMLGRGGGEAGLEAHYRAVYKPDAPGYRDMLTALDRLKDYAARNNIRVWLAMQPDVHNLTNYPFKYIHERLAGISRERNFHYIDLLPAFEGQTPQKIWAMSGDPHPNAFGHKLMADAIYPALKAK